MTKFHILEKKIIAILIQTLSMMVICRMTYEMTRVAME